MMLMILSTALICQQVSALLLTRQNIKPINSQTRISRHHINNNGPVQQRRGLVLLESSNGPINDNSPSKDDLTLFSELMSPVSSAQPDQMSASSLAYLCDVVFELFIRSRYVWPSRRMPQLQNTVVSLVNGE